VRACSHHKLLECFLVDDLRSTARPKRIPIFSLLSANAVSQVGDLMAMVAIPWFVLQTTGSAAKMGITGAAIGIGTVLAGIFGGPLVDRAGFKRTSVFADLASGTAVALVPLLHTSAVGLAFWQLLLLVFLRSFLTTPGRGARRALIPDLARTARMPLTRANAVDEAIQPLSFVIGPPLAGVLIVAIGSSNVLWLDAATFVLSALLVTLFVPATSGLAGASSPSGPRGYFTQLLQGVRFVRGNTLILSLLLVVTVANLLDDPLISVILPVYAKTAYGGAASLGLVLGGLGAGWLAGTVLYGAIGHYLPRRITFILSFVAAGPLPYLVLATNPPLAVAVGAFALAGTLGGPLNPLLITVTQEQTPQDMRGRVFGLLRALAVCGTPFGLLVGGFVVEGVGLRPTVIGMGICYLALTLSMFLNPALRGMEATKSR
jgi:MFS family permease